MTKYEPTSSISGRLFHLNQWIVPIVFLLIIPVSVWMNSAVNFNNSYHAELAKLIERNQMQLHFEIGSIQAPELKLRVETLEKSSISTQVLLAGMNTTLLEVRTQLSRISDKSATTSNK